MNIIIGCAVIAAAVYFRLRYRPEGFTARQLFRFCIAAGVVSMLTIECYDSLLMMLWPVAAIVTGGLLVNMYYKEAKKQRAARAALAAEKRRAAAERRRIRDEQARSRSRAAVYAFCSESCEGLAA